MEKKESSEQFIETRVSNLRAVVAAASFVLVMGTMVIINRYRGDELLYAVLFAATLSSVAYLSRFDYAKASAGLILLGFSVGAISAVIYPFADGRSRSLFALWIVVTVTMAALLYFLRRQSLAGNSCHDADA